MFRGNWLDGSGEEDFEGFLPYTRLVRKLLRHMRFNLQSLA